MKLMRILVAILLSFTLLLPTASAQIGPEFQSNTYTTAAQTNPGVAVDGAGNFVVVWQSYAQDGSFEGIFGQGYDSAGSPLGGEFQVNTYTTFRQRSPAIAADGAGNFVVVWQSFTQDGSFFGITGQRYDSAGSPLGGEFQVNTYTTFTQIHPAIAADGAGNFVVVWTSDEQDGNFYGVFGQRYDGGGNAVGAEFQVNTYTTSSQSRPAIAADAAGNFVVVWESYSGQDGNLSGIFGQRYDSGGNAAGAEFQVNTYTTSEQARPAIAADGAGNFVVVWRSFTQDGSDFGIFGQRYDSGGNAAGGEFQVNTYTTSQQYDLAVATDGTGNVVVVWTSDEQDGGGAGVFGQRYDSAGNALGAEFPVNGHATSDQRFSAVAADAAGNFVAAWSSLGQDGNNDGIFGQRFDAAGRQSVLGRVAKLTNRRSGTRRVKIRGSEPASNSTLLGDPLTYGATIEVIAHGDTDQDQSISLPPGAAAPGVPGWTLLPSGSGWRYSDRSGVNGPVKTATLKKRRRNFVVEAVIVGTASSPPPGVDLVPPGNGTDAGVIFTSLGPGGVAYCVSLGGSAGGIVSNTATTFSVFRAVTETGCPSP